MPSTSRPLSIPSHVGVPAISAVHCVSASTNTRSKNSSSGVTRSPSRSTAEMRGLRRAGEAVLIDAMLSLCIAPPLEQLEQLRERSGDRAHDPHERYEGGIALATFDRGEVAAAQLGSLGDVGLRQAVQLAQLRDRGAEVVVL